MKTMNFGEALELLRKGLPVCRRSWRDGFLILVPGSRIDVTADRPLGKAAPPWVGQQVNYAPHIDIMSREGRLGPWAAPTVDLLADDWAEWEPEP